MAFPPKQKQFVPTVSPNQGEQALSRLYGQPANLGTAMGITKSQVYPEQTDNRLENKFKALKSALARSTIGKPTGY